MINVKMCAKVYKVFKRDEGFPHYIKHIYNEYTLIYRNQAFMSRLFEQNWFNN